MPNKVFIPVLFLFIFRIIIIPQDNSGSLNNRVITYVNPFIGTSKGGNTFPGAAVPWGMVSVSPHNSLTAPSGYIYGEKNFYGFGMVHLSGTGCAELGSILITITKGENSIRPEDFKSEYSSEEASPGYYAVVLNEPQMRIEATASERTGFLRITSFIKSERTLVIDVGRSLGITGGGGIRIISGYEIEGYNISGGFCGEDNREEVYFYAQFSKGFKKYNLWTGDSIISSGEAEIDNNSAGGLLTFDFNEGEELLIKVGVSYVSTGNAGLNLESEIPHWDFNKVKNEAEMSWENHLRRIKIEDDNTENLIKFYSAFYHMLIHPNIISDVSGEYPLMGRGGTGRYTDRKRYSVFSLWDTYRTLHPFLTLVFPEVQSEIIKTMIDMYKESGYLPKWELAGNETYMMVGDPAPVVISDSYIKGITDFDTEAALNAVLKPVLLDENEKAPPVRAGYHEFLKYGYIPFEQDWSDDWWVWGPVSTTLEYCLSDFAISEFAGKLGYSNLSQIFYRRSMYYRNLFDPGTGFMRPRLRDGSWLVPFDSLATEGAGDWVGAGGPGYVEGNAWNYTWFVPHDVPGLIEIFGGGKFFGWKLRKAFEPGHFSINNEPDIAYPYLFNYIKGEEWETIKIVQSILNNEFKITPDGLPGNDDCGTISGWFVFSALGFYPDCPSSGFYQTGIPLFNKAVISLNDTYYPGNAFVIKKEHRERNGKKLKIELNGKMLSDYRIYHGDITQGGELLFISNESEF